MRVSLYHKRSHLGNYCENLSKSMNGLRRKKKFDRGKNKKDCDFQKAAVDLFFSITKNPFR